MAGVPSSAPCVELLKDLDSYKQVNQAFPHLAFRKILGHLWYLSEELIALTFFDPEVPIDTKNRMIQARSQKCC